MDRRRRVIALVVLAGALTSLAAVGWAVFEDEDTEVPEFCAGGGIISGITGRTPAAAMAEYVRSRGGDPEDWESTGSPTGYRRANPEAKPLDFDVLTVGEDRPGVWGVDSVCSYDVPGS